MVLKSASSDAPILFGEAENEPCVHYLMATKYWISSALSITTALCSYQPEGLITLFGSVWINVLIMGRFTAFCLFVDVNDITKCVTVSSIKPTHLDKNGNMKSKKHKSVFSDSLLSLTLFLMNKNISLTYSNPIQCLCECVCVTDRSQEQATSTLSRL